MKPLSFARFLASWCRLKTTRKSQKPARKRATPRFMRLNLESLEDRTLLSVVPPAIVTNQNSSFSAGLSPSIAIDPLNQQQMVEVNSTGSGIALQYTLDGGKTWSAGAGVGAIGDPNNFNFSTRTENPFPQVTNVGVTFDREGNFYVVASEHTSDFTTSGAIVLYKYSFPTDTGSATTPQLLTNNNNSDGTNNSNYSNGSAYQVLYRWAGHDAAYNPVVAVDNNVPSFTDPTATGQTQTDTMATNGTPKAVYVAWNTNYVLPSGDSPATGSAVMIAASDDGGLSFSTPEYVSTSGPSPGSQNSEPQILFTQGTANVAGGQMDIFSSNGTGVVLNSSRPDNGVASQPATAEQSFLGAGGNIGDATQTTVNSKTVTIPTTTNFTIPVSITDANFTSLDDLSVAINLVHASMDQVQIVLIPPTSSGLPSITLLSNHTNADGTTNNGVGVTGANLGVIQLTNPNNSKDIVDDDVGTVFDSTVATRAINDASTSAPFIGYYQPEAGSLTAYNGKTAAQLSGTWTLAITDNVYNSSNGAPTQYLKDWTLNFTSQISTKGFGKTQSTSASTVAGSPTNTYTNTATAGGTPGIGPGIAVAVDNTLGSFSPYQGRLYLAYVGGSGSNTNIYLIHSDDNGQHWSSPVQVNDDSASDNFSQGNRSQFMPSITVDQATGAVVVMYYDARWDAANARPANSLSVSIDGGDTFNQSVFLNQPQTATDEITASSFDSNNVMLAPIPGNTTAAGALGFGTSQGLVAYDGNIFPFFTSNLNSGGSSIMTARVEVAGGPRVVQADMGPVTQAVTDPTGSVTYNDTFAADGTRQLTGFTVVFDRPVLVSSFTADQVTVQYRSPSNAATNAPDKTFTGSSQLTVYAEDAGSSYPGLTGDPTQLATTFFIQFATPQSAVGTYSYSIGPSISDGIRSVRLENGSNKTIVGNQMDQNADAIEGHKDSNGNVVDSGEGGYDTFANPQSVTSALPPQLQQALAVTANVSLSYGSDTISGLSAATLSQLTVGMGVSGDGIPSGTTILATSNMGTTTGGTSVLLSSPVYPDTSNPVTVTFTPVQAPHLTFNLASQNLPSTDPTPLNGLPFQLPYNPDTLPLIIPGPYVVSTAAVPNQGATLAADTSGNNTLVLNGTTSAIDVTFDRDIKASTFTPSTTTISMVTPLGSTPITSLPITSFNLSTTTTSGSNQVTTTGGSTTANLKVGMLVTGTGILPDTVVSAIINNTTFLLSQAATQAATSLTFSDPFTITPVASSYNSADGGYRTFQISFPTQTLSGTYNLTFGPATSTQPMAITDTNGNAVDTNQNAGLYTLEGNDPTSLSTTHTSYTPPSSQQNVTLAAGQTISSTLPISDIFQIQQKAPSSDTSADSAPTDIEVGLNISFASPANDSDISNLSAVLIPPSGSGLSPIQLFTAGDFYHAGGSSTQPNVFTLSDFASTPIQNANTPLSGSYNPQQPLSSLNGIASNGTWTLQITNTGSNKATLNNWSLSLPHAVPGTGLGESVADQFSASFRIFSMGPNQATASQNWTAVGPASITTTDNNGNVILPQGASGRVSGLAVDPSDPSGNTVYAGGASGGIWKTTDFLTTNTGGPTWVPLTNLGPMNSLNIGSIAVIGRGNDPSQSIIFAATGEGNTGTPGVGLLRSEDGGKTWQVITGQSGNFTSTSDGAPPEPMDATGTRDYSFVGLTAFQVAVDPTPQRTGPNAGQYIVYAAFSDPTGGTAGGLFRSNNSGATWTPLQQGQATSVVLSPDSLDSNGNELNLFAGFQGKGIYSTNQAPTTGSLTLTPGNAQVTNRFNNDKVNHPAIPVSPSAVSPNGALGRIVLATPASTGNPLEDQLYSGWIYAAVVSAPVGGFGGGGSLVGLFRSEDSGANWTQVALPTYAAGYGTNDTSQPNYDPTSHSVNGFGFTQGNYDLSLAVDPTNANIVYLGGTDDGAPQPAGGFIRVDTTKLSDPYALVAYNNSAPDGGKTQTATTGTVTLTSPGATYGMLNPNSNQPFQPGSLVLSSYLNMVRDPYDPFATSNSNLPFTNVSSFNNQGTGATWGGFNDFLQGSTDQHVLLVIKDPTTGQARLIAGDDQGVWTGVDDGTGQFITSLGSQADSSGGLQQVPFGTRNGNLSLTQMYSSAAQPSTLAATIAGAFLYATDQDTGFPESDPNLLTDGNLAWEGTLGDGQYVQTDQTGSGQAFEYRWPMTNPEINGALNFFMKNFPNPSLASVEQSIANWTGDVGYTGHSLLQTTNNVPDNPATNTGQWPGLGGSNFAINPIDPSALAISSQTGEIFITTDGGLDWYPKAGPPQGGYTGLNTLDSSYSPALAFGAPDPSSSALDNFLYAGNEKGNIWVTRDGGGTWTEIGTSSNGLDGSAVQQIITSPQRGSAAAYAVTQQGVYWTPNSSLTIQGTLTSGSTTVTNLSSETVSELAVGTSVSGTGIASNTTVAKILSPTSIQLSSAATTTGTETLNFAGGVTWTNITSNLFGLNRPTFNNAGDPYPTLHNLTSIAGDYRFNVPNASLTAKGTLTSGSTDVTGLAATTVSQLTVGMTVTGTNIPSGATIAAILSSTSVRLSANASGGGSQNLTFSGAVHPVLYVAGSGGVFRSADNGTTWNYYPNATQGATQVGGFLPNVPITGLQLVLGNINPSTGLPNTSAGLNTLIATTYGQGDFAIRMNNSDVSQYVAIPNGGPYVSSVVPIAPSGSPDYGNDMTGMTVTFSGPVDPSTVSMADIDQLTDPNGNAVAIQDFVDITSTSSNGQNLHNVWRIDFTTPQTTRGNYTLVLGKNASNGTYITDDSGNPIDQDQVTSGANLGRDSDGDSQSTPDAEDLFNSAVFFAGNQSPTISTIGNTVVNENSSTAVSFTVGSRSSASNTQLTVSATETDANGNAPGEGLLPSSSLSFGSTVNSNGNPTSSSGNVTLTITPPANEVGTTYVTITVSDPSHGQTQETFAVQIRGTATLPFTDNVNRPNNTFLGPDWNVVSGSVTDNNDQASFQTTPSTAVLNGLSVADVDESASVTLSEHQQAGLVARYQGSGDQNMYFGTIGWGPDLGISGSTGFEAAIYKNVSGTWTLLNATALGNSTTLSGTVTFDVVQDSLKLYFQPTGASSPQLETWASDDSLTQAGGIGIRGWAGATMGNYYADSFSAPAQPLPVSDNFSTPGSFSGTYSSPASGTPTNGQLQNFWVSQRGNFTDNGSAAVGSSQAVNLAVVNGSTAADVTESAGIKVGQNQMQGLVARYQGDLSGGLEQNMYYGAIAWGPSIGVGSGLEATIYKNVNGSWTALDTEALSNTDSQGVSNGTATLTFQVVQDSLKLFLTPTSGSSTDLVAFASDSSITQAGEVGIRGWAGATFTNFTASSTPASTQSLPASDNFSTAGTNGQLQSFWVSQAGNFTDNGSAAVASSRAVNLAVVNGSTAADVTESAGIKVGQNQLQGLVARYQGAAAGGLDQNMYLGTIVWGPSINVGSGLEAVIYKNVNGTWTALDTEALGNTDSQGVSNGTATLTFQVVQDSLKLFVTPTSGSNADLVAFANDSSISQAGEVGIRGWAGATFTNFTASSTPAATQPLPASDSFSTAGTNGQLQSFWVSQAGNFTDNGSAAVASSRAVNLAVVNGGSAINETESATINKVGQNQMVGLVARYQGSGDQNMYYGAIAWGPSIGVGSGLEAVIYKNVGGTWTLLGSTALSNTDAQKVSNGTATLTFQVAGTSQKLFLNTGSGNTQYVSTNDSSINRGGEVGIRTWANSTVANFQETAGAAALPFSDSFTQSNGTSLSSTNWVTESGGFTIQNNMAQGTSSSQANVAVLNSGSVADVTESADVNVAQNQLAGLVARYQGTGDQNMYYGTIGWGPTLGISGSTGFEAAIFKNVGGNWTLLNATAVSGGTGTLTFEVVQNSLKLFFMPSGGSTSLVAFANDSSITQAGQVGIRTYGANSTVDNYQASTFSATPATLPFSDTFSSAGPNGQLSRSWVSQVGNFSDDGTEAVASSQPINLAVLSGASTADVTESANVSVTGTGQQVGLVARYQGSGDQNMYLGVLSDQNGTIYGQIWKNVGGNWTMLTQSQALSNGTGRLVFQVQGSTLRLFLDTGSGPQQIASASDSSITAAGAMGIRGWPGSKIMDYSVT